MLEKMRRALGRLSTMVNMYFPEELRAALLEQSAELDRLRADVNDLRQQLKKEI
jgi:hypothetical protein